VGCTYALLAILLYAEAKIISVARFEEHMDIKVRKWNKFNSGE
jgi:hypothetical protein